jgi:ACR3 family arsenite transporter
MNIFSKYLTLWVALCIVVGVFVGMAFPGFVAFMDQFTFAQINIPIAILIWVMIYPMMLKIDFGSIKKVGQNPKGLVVTTVTNWIIKPFSMYAIAYFFFYVVFGNIIDVDTAREYLVGAVLLGAAPCTAMVFVWSHLVKGNSAYTAVQVALNDFILLFAFTPIVALLLGISDIQIPYDTLFLSVVLFIVLPIGFAWLTRKLYKSDINNLIDRFNGVPESGLLLTLVLIFMFQGDVILNNPLDILLIAVPLIIQTLIIFLIAYGWGKLWKLPHDIAAPGGLIGASNFFELAVAVAIALFGLNSGATLATVVGVLVEVPLMLFLVGIANRTRKHFDVKEA